MEKIAKKKRRGFVMTGGGAKGLYEAGVIHAFHLMGMEFDVITGSSIGAMNSIFYAEYLFCKRQLRNDVLQDPLLTIEHMDEVVKAFHHAWLTMPDKQLINDSAEGPLGQLKDDLRRFRLTLPQLTRILWWWTDPARGIAPPAGLWLDFLRLGLGLIGRLGLFEVLRIFLVHQKEWKREALRAYLARFSLERSLVPDGEDSKIKDIFTEPISPLSPEHLSGSVTAPDAPGTHRHRLVDPNRTLRDYAQNDIHVRLTRANYRTGRLEISSYVTEKEFAMFLDRQAWRISAFGPEKIPLGSFRLKVPGNPLALNAALCSGRFPGVFLPYRLKDIYAKSDSENTLLYRLLDGWLSNPQVASELQPIVADLNPDPLIRDKKWKDWQESNSIRTFFPQSTDTYVDGGAIDNTPYTAAVDYVRDSLMLTGGSTQDESLDLYVIYLETEPKVEYAEVTDPYIFEVVNRTLALVNAANEKSRGTTFDTLNSFGKRAEQIAKVLSVVLDSYKETLKDMEPAQRRQAEEKILKQVQGIWKKEFSSKTPDGVLDTISAWTDKTLISRLPLQVETVKIYPQAMPLNTLQFTERLGYKKENAVQMLAMGCYSTLDGLRTRLEACDWEKLDGHDQRALTLVRRWTGNLWQAPAQPEASNQTLPIWQCQRIACTFHATACLHGAKAKNPSA